MAKNFYFKNLLTYWVLSAPGLCFALSVEDVIKATVATHPAVQSQLSQLDASQADIQTARQQFYPTPSVSVEQVNSSASDWQYGQRSTLQTYRLQQPLWTGGRLTAGLDRAKSNARVAGEAVNDVRQQLAFRAVQAWSEWYLSAMRVRAQEQSVDTHQRLMAVVRRRASEGATASSELSLTQSRLDQALAQQQAYIAQQKLAMLKLAQLIGRNLAATDSPQVAGEILRCERESLADRAIEASAALKKIKVQQESIGFEIQERRAELTPELYLRVERQRSPTQSGTVMNTFDRVYVGFSSRFGPGLSNLSAIESLEKKRDALRAEYEAAERNLLEVVQSDLEQLRSITARLPLLRNALDASVQTAQAWDRQFLAGRRAWTEVMNAAREVAQADIEWSDARASHIGLQWRLRIFCGELQDLLGPVGQDQAIGTQQ